MPSRDTIAGLLSEVEEVVLEVERVGRDEISEQLIAGGERLRATLRRAESQVARSQIRIEAVEQLRHQILQVCERLDRVLQDARMRTSTSTNTNTTTSDGTADPAG